MAEVCALAIGIFVMIIFPLATTTKWLRILHLRCHWSNGCVNFVINLKLVITDICLQASCPKTTRAVEFGLKISTWDRLRTYWKPRNGIHPLLCPKNDLSKFLLVCFYRRQNCMWYTFTYFKIIPFGWYNFNLFKLILLLFWCCAYTNVTHGSEQTSSSVNKILKLKLKFIQITVYFVCQPCRNVIFLKS